MEDNMPQLDHDNPNPPPTSPAPSSIPRKPIKPPSITPRRFRKFFNPPTYKIQAKVRTSRRALQEITNPPGQEHPAPCSRLAEHEDDLENGLPGPNDYRGSKRKLSFGSVESPLLSSPLRPEPFFLSSSQVDPEDVAIDGRRSRGSAALEQESDEEDATDCDSQVGTFRNRRNAVQKFNTLSKSSDIFSTRISGRSRKRDPKSSNIWQSETASFYSNAQDAYFCGSQTHAHPALPFCTASCNTNSLIAIGDEEGSVRLLDSAVNVADGFSKTYLAFKPHDNAVMDLAFSDDDSLLATGSGDQHCRVIDMMTQKTLRTLSGHSSSIKQVRFQPESRNSILASCSRDGNVNIWDLRTKSVDRPAQRMYRASSADGDDEAVGFRMPAASLRDTIRAAHSGRDGSRKAAVNRSKAKHCREEASVTSLVFLGAGREYLLATSSEADATVKLWDMRTTYDTRRARPLPLSTTRQPHSHQQHRPFGLTSMVLSSDGARLYTLCRDHTLYAYSTSHLILGSAPELTTTSIRPRRAGGAEREGLSPIYGFRHRQLEVSTFYVKLTARKAKDDKTELLATGSGSDCAIIFPTDERYLGCRPSPHSIADQARPSLRRSSSGYETAVGVDDEIPIYRHGTALIRGHRKEVTAVAWTNGGDLITTSDDFQARCWRDGEGEEARGLRVGGEGEGRRWMCGWADVDSAYDEDE